MAGLGPWARAARALRAPHWWYFALLPLVSLVGARTGEDLPARLGGGVVIAALCLAYAYGLNGITDRHLDHNATKNSLAGFAAVPNEAVLVVAGCALAALGVAALLTPGAFLGATVSVIASTLYSAQPRLKRLPVIGTVVNVLIFAPLPLLAVAGAPSAGEVLLAYCFWVLVTQNQILHEVSDAAEDAAAGVRTTSVVAGVNGLRAIALVLGPIGALPLYWIPVSAAALGVATLGLCGGALMVAVCRCDRARELRLQHRWYSLAVGILLFALQASAAWAWGGHT